jgi:UDP-glucose 4-epimerase
MKRDLIFMKNILVVGGAGYIGSYMCKYLAKKGYNPIVLDNLVYGHRQAVGWGPFIEGSMADSKLLKSIFTEYRVEAVKELGWKPQFADLSTIIETAWKWHKSHPEGW